MFIKRKLSADFAALSRKPLVEAGLLQLMLGGAGNDCVLQCFAWFCQETPGYLGSGTQTQYWDAMLQSNFGYSVDSTNSPCGPGAGICPTDIIPLGSYGSISVEYTTPGTSLSNFTPSNGQQIMLTYGTAGQSHAVIFKAVEGNSIKVYDPQNNIYNWISQNDIQLYFTLSYN